MAVSGHAAHARTRPLPDHAGMRTVSMRRDGRRSRPRCRPGHTVAVIDPPTHRGAVASIADVPPCYRSPAWPPGRRCPRTSPRRDTRVGQQPYATSWSRFIGQEQVIDGCPSGSAAKRLVGGFAKNSCNVALALERDSTKARRLHRGERESRNRQEVSTDVLAFDTDTVNEQTAAANVVNFQKRMVFLILLAKRGKAVSCCFCAGLRAYVLKRNETLRSTRIASRLREPNVHWTALRVRSR